MPTQYETDQATASDRYRGGGRVASDALRRSYAQCNEFEGLEEGADRYGLLLLVKRVGKLAGFTPRMICLLDYYLAYTRDCDWEAGSRPIVYQSLARTALDLGVSERQIQKLEAALFASGAITWNDSGNHKRYGQRDPETGRIAYAFGVDLTPLAYHRDELEAKLRQKKRYDDAWMETKRRISWQRRQLRAVMAEWGGGTDRSAQRLAGIETRYDAIATPIRTHVDLTELRALLAQHEGLLEELTATFETEKPAIGETAVPSVAAPKGSCTDEPEFAHYKYTTQEPKNFCSPPDDCLQRSVVEPPAPPTHKPSSGRGLFRIRSSGMEHVTLGIALGSASERLAKRLPSDPGWTDLVEAAYSLRPEMGVSESSWGEACQVLGRHGAAVCLLITDRATLRENDPVSRPAAYFRGLISRAERGDLRLHASLFCWLSRERKG